MLRYGVGVDPARWALTSDGALLVLAQVLGGEEVWMLRSYLADPFFEMTTKEIEAHAARQEALDRETYWSKERKRYQGEATVTVTQQMAGIDFLDEVYQLPPGTYKLFSVLDKRLEEGQRTPFSLRLSVGSDVVDINPDLLSLEASHLEAARTKALDVAVPARRIVEVFAAAPETVSRHVPRGAWLADDSIHYVTPEQMGAVFVLERMPEAEEVEPARSRSPQVFLEGANSPGVRFGSHIFVQAPHRGTGVEFHESVHLLSGVRRGLLHVFGHAFNEGATEYLTRLALEKPLQRGEVVRSDDQYLLERLGVEALLEAGLFTQDELAAAYFEGQVQPLFAGTERVMKGRPFSLQGYAARLTSQYSFSARQTLERVLAEEV